MRWFFQKAERMTLFIKDNEGAIEIFSRNTKSYKHEQTPCYFGMSIDPDRAVYENKIYDKL